MKMKQNNKTLVIDIDGTLCRKMPGQEYIDAIPNLELISRIKDYKNNGFYIILYTSRNMRTYENCVGLINANTSKILFQWLDKYQVPYDEIYFGKPWCGNSGFYIDDKAIRPSEFLEKNYDDIMALLNEEKGKW